MQGNETLLERWIEALCAELGELSGASITNSMAPHESSRQQAYETALLAQGPVQGELYITVEAGALVQLTQLAEGVPLDPEVSCDPERIEAWRRLLNSTATRLSTRLTEDFTDSTNSRCVLLLADTHLLADEDPFTGEPGSRIERWLLQAGQTRIAILGRARIELPDPAAKEADVSPQQAASAEAARPAEVKSDARSSGQPDGPPPGRAARDFADNAASQAQMRRLDLLLDIELEATLRFGAIEMPLREVLELGPGDVLSLDRHVQEPVELVVGDRIVARGEVVLIGGNFGLQVTEVAEPRRRLETIRCLF